MKRLLCGCFTILSMMPANASESLVSSAASLSSAMPSAEILENYLRTEYSSDDAAEIRAQDTIGRLFEAVNERAQKENDFFAEIKTFNNRIEQDLSGELAQNSYMRHNFYILLRELDMKVRARAKWVGEQKHFMPLLVSSVALLLLSTVFNLGPGATMSIAIEDISLALPYVFGRAAMRGRYSQLVDQLQSVRGRICSFILES